MAGKNILCVTLILLLIASTTTVSVSAEDPTVVSLSPLESTAQELGETLLINVTITNVTDWGAWWFKLDYNTTLLDAVYIHPTWVTANNTDWGPVDGMGIYHPDGPPVINETAGTIWVYALIPVVPDYGYNGSFPIVTINFTATALGDCTLDLYDVKISDSWGDPISPAPVVYDGSVTVVPEFPAIIVMPLLLIATLAAAFLGKMVWSRKRKDALIAE